MTRSPSRVLVVLGMATLAASAWAADSSPAPQPGFPAILPPLVAIATALWTRQVLPALFGAVVLGAILQQGGALVAGFSRATTHYLPNAIADFDHAAIILFSTALAGMVGVMSRSGGTQGVVELMSPYARTPLRAQLATWFMGLLIFFDDYANTLLVGTTMRPLCDRLKISRAKLAFIVDATAAPVAGLAAISTWIGFEVGLIQDAFRELGRTQDGYLTFLDSIPLRFYSIFCLFLIVVLIFSRRDFGPMLESELAARQGKSGPLSAEDDPALHPALLPAPGQKRHWVHAMVPIFFIFLGTAMGLWFDGRAKLADAALTRRIEATTTRFVSEGRLPAPGSVPEAEWARQRSVLLAGVAPGLEAEAAAEVAAAPLRDVLSEASANRVLMLVSILGTILAILLPVATGVLPVEPCLSAWMEGAKGLLPALVILVLAWSLGAVCKDLGTAQVLAGLLEGVLQPGLLPALTFLAAAGISFATGTSWGTMSILMPLSIQLAVKLAGPAAARAGAIGSPEYLAAEAPILLGTVGAVLAGSCFGDHCSPISDTTILSSMASGCDHVEHVRTQMPYALVSAAAAVVLGHIPAGYGVPPSLCLLLGMASLVGLVFLVGRPTDSGDVVREEPGRSPGSG